MSGSVGDNTARASGVIASAGGGGKVLQVLEYSTTGTISRNATSWGAYGSVEQAITPIAAGSKIKLTLSTGVTGNQNRAFLRFYYDVDGGGYNVCDPVGAASGARTNCHFNLKDSQVLPGNITIFHTPSYSLGNVLTYQVWSWTQNTTYPIYFGRDWTDSSSAQTPRTQTIFRVEEIGA